jgi:hypothetical protein
MYMMSQPKAKWTIARARQELPALIGAAAREPQRVYKRDKLVAAVVSPEIAEELAVEKRGLADSLAELQQLCAQEDYRLPEVVRRDRPDPTRPRRRKR